MNSITDLLDLEDTDITITDILQIPAHLTTHSAKN